MKVLFISYTGLAEPLGRSQVLPYIDGLAKQGHTFVVLSFEKPQRATHISRSEVRELLPAGSQWVALSYHKRPTLPATSWDVLHGIALGLLVPGIDLIHARSTVAALTARAIAAAKRVPWIFDVRGFIAQEYADAGHWRSKGALVRIADHIEQRLLKQASGVVLLTNRAREACQYRWGRDRPTVVIPCAVDLARFRYDQAAGQAVRHRHGLQQYPVMVYSGSLGSWYLPGEMLDFMAAARSQFHGLRFLVLSPEPDLIEKEAARRGLRDQVIARSVSPVDVPAYLSAADFGISFVAASPSKAASSPTKIAEYLACGLPVLSTAGVGDVEAQARDSPWVVVRGFERSDYESAASQLSRLLSRGERRREARGAAERLFSLEAAVGRYQHLYESVLTRRRP